MTHRKRNPWHGQNDAKEFLWDMRHPGQFLADAWDGVRGRNGLSDDMRIMACCMVCLGVLQVIAGALALALVYT